MMRAWKAMLALMLALCALSAWAQKADDGWRQLFNGRDLTGWRHVGPGGFTVEKGLLKSVGGMGLLYWTGGPVGDCQLRVVFRMTHENDNSGVFVRIPIEPREEWMPVHYGYEAQIDNRADEYHRTGVLYSFTRALASPGRPGPEWNTMLITLRGDRTTIEVNGVLVTDFVDSEAAQASAPKREHDWEAQRGVRPRFGWIGLQNHSPNDVALFKEVSLRPLP